jgi:hypothetical protein
VHHQDPLRRGTGRPVPSGPPRGRPETLGGHRDYGIPLGIAAAGANRHDSPLLVLTLQAAAGQLGHTLPAGRTCHLDAGYDSGPTRQTLDELGFAAQIARKGAPALIQAGRRWLGLVSSVFVHGRR